MQGTCEIILAPVVDIALVNASFDVNVNVNQKFFCLAKIAKLLRRPQGRSVIKAPCQEKTGERNVFTR